MSENNGCTCEGCRQACQYNPGWFLPGEAERVAEFLNLTLQELFNTKLGVNWWVAAEDIFVLAPAITKMSPGREYPGDPRGKCIFYNSDGLCEIHPVKPFECREYNHDHSKEQVHERHKKTAMAWESDQTQIQELLEREPVSASFSFFDFF